MKYLQGLHNVARYAKASQKNIQDEVASKMLKAYSEEQREMLKGEQATGPS